MRILYCRTGIREAAALIDPHDMSSRVVWLTKVPLPDSGDEPMLLQVTTNLDEDEISDVAPNPWNHPEAERKGYCCTTTWIAQHSSVSIIEGGDPLELLMQKEWPTTLYLRTDGLMAWTVTRYEAEDQLGGDFDLSDDPNFGDGEVLIAIEDFEPEELINYVMHAEASPLVFWVPSWFLDHHTVRVVDGVAAMRAEWANWAGEET